MLINTLKAPAQNNSVIMRTTQAALHSIGTGSQYVY